MLVDYNNKKICLPDFLIVGAAKSGTSSLFYYLNQHSEIFIPKIKEPWFFHLYGKDYFSHNRTSTVNNIDDYCNLYKDKTQFLLGDASTIYLYDYKNVIDNIKSIYGEDYRKVKIIIILRNPIDRAYSHYLNHVRDNVENCTFKECFDKSVENKLNFYNEYFKYGLYSKQIVSYLENFDNVKIVLSERFNLSKINVFESILQFLDLKNENINLNVNRNKTGVSRSNFLYNIIQSENNFFKKIIKIILPYNLGITIKSKLIDLLLYKPEINHNLKIDLNNYFKNDIDSLKNILNEELQEWEK